MYKYNKKKMNLKEFFIKCAAITKKFIEKDYLFYENTDIDEILFEMMLVHFD